jgi:hypothetical protein
MRRKEVKRAATTLVILLTSYWLYVSLIVPVIEPPVRPRSLTATAEDITTPTVVRYHEELTHLFPADAWETKSPKVLRNRDTLLLFQDYAPQEDGTIKIFPCTVVLRDEEAGEKGDASVLILQAPEGAVLQLNRPVDLRGAQLGQPVAGRLLGRIEIHSPGRADGTGKLHVVTSNVQINPARLWTPNEVEFRYDRNVASGRDLMIKLLPSQSDESGDSPVGWAGIRSIELVRLHQLHLEIESQDTRNLRTLADATSTPPVTTSTPVDVSCTGPLRIDFVENAMTLEDRVALQRTNPDGKVDSLHCDRLTLYLKQTTAEAVATTTGQTTNQAIPRHVVGKPVEGKGIPAADTKADRRFAEVPKLELKRVVAEGTPVVLDAQSQSVQVRSHKLLYDLELGRFRIWASDQDTDDQVLFRYEQQRVWAREIDCTLDKVSQGVERVRAVGPGKLAGTMPGDDAQPIRAFWQQMLLFQKESPTSYQLSVTVQAQVEVGEAYRIDAERLHVWLEPDPSAESAGQGDNRGESDDDRGLGRLRPQRVVAIAHPERPQDQPVRLRASGMTGITERLEAQFVHVAAPPLRPLASRSAVPAREVTFRSQADTAEQRRPVARPSLPAATTAAGSFASERETQVSGRSLNVLLRVTGDEVTVDNLVLQEKVSVKQFEQNGAGTPLFELLADTVRMQQAGEPQQHALVAEGRPVQIRSDQMKLFTTQMHVNQATNLVWSERPGRMVVRVDRDAEGQPLATPASMTVDWSRGMEFDGLQARFLGRVEVRGPDQRMRGEALSVQLSERLAFGEKSSGHTPEIQQVRGEGNVHLEMNEYEQGDLTARTYLQVPFAQINRQTGDIRCGGPGRVVTIRRGFGGGMELNAGNSAANTRRVANVNPAETRAGDSSELTFLQIDFQRQIDGNLHRRVVDFEDRVQVIYGPVQSWNEALRADAPLRKNDVLLTCDQMTVAQGTVVGAGSASNSFDLVARGNAYVEGQAFTARAERISYEQAKDQLILEGTGHTDAVLSHQERIGAPRSEIAARKILFWRKSQRVKVEDARMLDLSNLGL